ncbi:MAG: radical SAM protein [Clostridia bacterium]|nr:radical SAM protein [Clostridia bacterium]
MFKRAYVEITNVCNLNCSFCPGTKRTPAFMSPEQFRTVVERVRPHTEYLYLHLMGEPLLHPDLEKILEIAHGYGFSVNLTTNGTLLPQVKKILLRAEGIRKVSVSLHSFEGNGGGDMRDYLAGVWAFAERFHGITALRLWNAGGEDKRNGEIFSFLSEALGTDVASLPEQNGNRKLNDGLYLERAEKFDWPSLDAKEQDVTFCYGLGTQFGVLVDGTVVPCCLDCDGNIPLGNLFDSTLDEILSSPRAAAFRQGISAHKPSEELCRKCGFATRF